MYPRIPWELVADALGSVEHTSGTTSLRYSQQLLVSNEFCHFFGKDKVVFFLSEGPEGTFMHSIFYYF